MLEQLRALNNDGRYMETRRLAPAFLASSTAPEELSMGHALLSVAYQLSATCAGDWQQALINARACRDLAPRDTYLHVWALNQVAVLAGDTGRFQEASAHAAAFLREEPKYERAAHFKPWVIRTLTQVAFHRGDYLQAAALRRQALTLFEAPDNAPEVARTRLNLVWAYARAGRASVARMHLPETVPADMENLRCGAMAAVLAAEGRWAEALDAGQAALRGDRRSFDLADAAEVCLILAKCAHRLGLYQAAFAYIREAASFAARQDRKALVLLALTLGREGGVFLDAAASPCGSGGYHPGSPRFLSGVA